jgi:hypothetical protein
MGVPDAPSHSLVNAAQAARRLGMHRNSLLLRIRRAIRDGQLQPRGYTARQAPLFAWAEIQTLWGKAPPPRPGVKRTGPSAEALDHFTSVVNELLGRRPV